MPVVPSSVLLEGLLPREKDGPSSPPGRREAASLPTSPGMMLTVYCFCAPAEASQASANAHSILKHGAFDKGPSFNWMSLPVFRPHGILVFGSLDSSSLWECCCFPLLLEWCCLPPPLLGSGGFLTIFCFVVMFGLLLWVVLRVSPLFGWVVLLGLLLLSADVAFPISFQVVLPSFPSCGWLFSSLVGW